MPSSLLLLASDSVNVVQAIKENDFVGFVCLIVLTILSVISTMLIIFKYQEMRKANQQSERFQSLVDSDGSWEALFMASKNYPMSPIARLLKATYVECRMENWFQSKKPLSIDNRLEVAKETVSGTLMRTMAQEETKMHSKLTILSTVSTVAPFIGLLGTVWGVLASFQAVGREGGAALSSLAPGISTALMTTIFGLLAAIPAVVFYNHFMREAGKMSNWMETFAHDIDNAVRKQILMEEEKR